MKLLDLTPEVIDRLVEMAWEDRTPFEAIELQFGLLEKDVIALMRHQMKPSSFRMWRDQLRGAQARAAAARGRGARRGARRSGRVPIRSVVFSAKFRYVSK